MEPPRRRMYCGLEGLNDAVYPRQRHEIVACFSFTAVPMEPLTPCVLTYIKARAAPGLLMRAAFAFLTAPANGTPFTLG